MKVKDSKEVVVAKITTRQAIIVAVISFFSAVAVPLIAIFVSTNNEVPQELVYIQTRAGITENDLRETEEALQARLSELQSQQAIGRFEETNRKLEETNRKFEETKELFNELRIEEVEFQGKRDKLLEATESGKRLDASKIKTEINEGINRFNFKLRKQNFREIHILQQRKLHAEPRADFKEVARTIILGVLEEESVPSAVAVVSSR